MDQESGFQFLDQFRTKIWDAIISPSNDWYFLSGVLKYSGFEL